MIKAVVFDFGGVLFTEGTYLAVAEIAKLTGVSEEKVLEVLDERDNLHHKAYRLGEIDTATFWSHALKEWGIDYDWKKLDDVWRSAFHPNTEVINLFKRLSAKYKTGVLTNNTPGRYLELIKKNGLGPYIQVAVVSYIDRVQKPEPASYQMLINRLGTSPGDVVFVDDRNENVVQADKMGLNAILYSSFNLLKSELGKFGVEA